MDIFVANQIFSPFSFQHSNGWLKSISTPRGLFYFSANYLNTAVHQRLNNYVNNARLVCLLTGEQTSEVCTTSKIIVLMRYVEQK